MSTRDRVTAQQLSVGVFMPVRPTDSIALLGHDGVFVAALERELRAHRTLLTLCGIERHEDIAEIAGAFSGIVLIGFRDREIESLPGLVPPVVVIDSYADRTDVTFVRTDDYDGGRRAAQYLTTRGHRDILFVGPARDRSGVVRERFAGFTASLSAADAAGHTRVTAGVTRREGIAVGRTLMQQHPTVTGVFAMADTLALGVIEGLVLSGREVPANVSVIGFDDLALASMTTPKLSSVAQDIPRKARLAAEALRAPRESNDLFIVGVDIVERASVSTPSFLAVPAS